MPSLPYWLYPGDDRPPAEIDDEVAEELRLHLDLLAEARMRQGVTPDEAKQQAAERFGDFDTLLRQCRLEKQGDLPMLKRIQAVLTLLLLLVVVWLGVREYFNAATTSQYMNQTTSALATIQGELSQLRDALTSPQSSQQLAKSPLQPTRGFGGRYSSNEIQPGEQRVVIIVQDRHGEPIKDAELVVTRSSRRSTPSPETLTVGPSGRVELDYSVVSVVASAPGYALISDFGGGPSQGDDTLVLAMEPSQRVEVQITLPDGKPARHMSVVPLRRTDLKDRSHEFPSLARDLWSQTDDKGRVTLDWLQPGDLAWVKLKERSKFVESATTVEFEVSRDPSKVVTINLKEGRGEFGGGGEYGVGGEYGGGFGGGGYGGEYGAAKPYEVNVVDEQEPPAADEAKSDPAGSKGS